MDTCNIQNKADAVLPPDEVIDPDIIQWMEETGLDEEEYWIYQYSQPGRELLGFSIDPQHGTQLVLGERMHPTLMDSVAQIERLDRDESHAEIAEGQSNPSLTYSEESEET